jgi:FkbM family methyltransferase
MMAVVGSLGLGKALRRLYYRNRLVSALLAPAVAWRQRFLARRGVAVRGVTRRLGASIVGDVVLELPEFSGQFACSPRSDLFARIAERGCYEPDLVALLRSHLDPQRDFIDVGANIGFYSVLAAKTCPQRRVLAVEPNPEARRRLIDNLARNRVEEAVTVFAGLASDSPGEAGLNLIEGMEEYSSMGRIVHAAVAGEATRRLEVPAETLDRLVARFELTPGLIKIDVEGAEKLVLDGAAETLKRFRPVILSELSPALLGPMGASAAAIIAQLEHLGYRVVDAQDPALPPGSRQYGDVLCLPI